MQTIIKQLQTDTGIEVTHWQALPGESVGSCFQLQSHNELLFLKYLPNAPGQLFACEAQGLNALGQTQAIRSPQVVMATQQALVTEWIDIASPHQNSFALFGNQLAQLHRYTHTEYGFENDNFCGATPQKNHKEQCGYHFFAEHRLLFQAKLAKANDLLSNTELHQIESISCKLQQWIPEQPASLLHGDLWSGNLLFDTNQQPVLIDPACYYGWRESELAMTALFGGFQERFYQAYNEQWPMESGWRERFPLYNLYHLLNHLNLFGSSYFDQVKAILNRFAD